MSERDDDQRLSQISTMWTRLRKAHEGPGDAAAAARQALMERYCGAVYRYLLAAVRDPDVAQDLTQEFALRFVRGRFEKATPERGRFRDYVKTSLFHLVDDYRREQARVPRPVPFESEPAAAENPSEAEQSFIASWRQELLERCWEALAEVERTTGKPYHAVLRLRVAHSELTSTEQALRLSEQLGRPISSAGVRQLLHRAREQFAKLLLEETARSLGTSDRDQVDQELGDLDLLKYCLRSYRT